MYIILLFYIHVFFFFFLNDHYLNSFLHVKSRVSDVNIECKNKTTGADLQSVRSPPQNETKKEGFMHEKQLESTSDPTPQCRRTSTLTRAQ